MKYYISKIEHDPLNNDLEQIITDVEIGDPLASNLRYTQRLVADKSGNAFYSYDTKIGMVTSAGVKHEWDVNTCFSLTSNKVVAIGLNRACDYLFVATNTGITGTELCFWRVPVANFETTGLAVGDLYKSMANYTGMRDFKVDKNNNLWFVSTYSGSHYACIIENFTLKVYKKTHAVLTHAAVTILFDNYNKLWCFSQAGTAFCALFQFTNGVLDDLNLVSDDYNKLPKEAVQDAIFDKNNNIWTIENDKLNSNKIWKIPYSDGEIDFDNVDSWVAKDSSGNELKDIYNLHTNGDGDIFFTSYGDTDGYKMYIIANGFGEEDVEFYMWDRGSYVTYSDPFGYYVSIYGHTGRNS